MQDQFTNPLADSVGDIEIEALAQRSRRSVAKKGFPVRKHYDLGNARKESTRFL